MRRETHAPPSTPVQAHVTCTGKGSWYAHHGGRVPAGYELDVLRHHACGRPLADCHGAHRCKMGE